MLIAQLMKQGGADICLLVLLIASLNSSSSIVMRKCVPSKINAITTKYVKALAAGGGNVIDGLLGDRK